VQSASLYDKTGWLKLLQDKGNHPYPKSMRAAIIAKNYPILPRTISSYTHHIQKAISRKDSVSIIHQTAALLARYFDIIFALNSVPHPCKNAY
jgi:hypothetical protein